MKAQKNAIEWAVFAASVVVIAGAAWLLVQEALSAKEGKANLRIETAMPMRSSSGYAVPVVVTNDGDATAEQVRIEMALLSAGREIERSELTIAFVPRKSRREGVVVFRRDPACCTLVTRTTSYEKP